MKDVGEVADKVFLKIVGNISSVGDFVSRKFHKVVPCYGYHLECGSRGEKLEPQEALIRKCLSDPYCGILALDVMRRALFVCPYCTGIYEAPVYFFSEGFPFSIW